MLRHFPQYIYYFWIKYRTWIYIISTTYIAFLMQIVEYFFIISGELFIMFRQKNVLILFQEGKTSLGISMSF